VVEARAQLAELKAKRQHLLEGLSLVDELA
jgi:hypothetical protein